MFGCLNTLDRHRDYRIGWMRAAVFRQAPSHFACAAESIAYADCVLGMFYSYHVPFETRSTAEPLSSVWRLALSSACGIQL